MLNDIAEKFDAEKKLGAEAIDSLEILWRELQDVDREVSAIFDQSRISGHITAEESLISTCYFLVAGQVGRRTDGVPEVAEFMKQAALMREMGIHQPERSHQARTAIVDE